MAYVLPINELGDPDRVRDVCRHSSDPVFVSDGDQDEFVILNMSVYRELYAKLQVYQRLEEGERDVAAGRDSDAFEMLDRVGNSANV